ncbi:hypothetical protein C7999DRAFT_10053 [Corynascus novoguineensis]|uniref:Uncharacterized protein n=1 Tax=Corynascus novoguineensis TaxID=1126955 RepID=A0AAN7D5S4_9PEZI|nr:hypothetical protein C7999DRAFT_10053 [Corynascus novoguineensis]
MSSLQITTFANTFLVTNGGLSGPVLESVGPHETRKKRPHRCDEGDPCRNCVKRKETCVRLGQTSPSQRRLETPPPTSPPPEVTWPPLSEEESSPINLLHMELLHHFERYTIPTLPFQDVWPKMLQLVFQSQQHIYLLNAMLSLAAAHLNYLCPGRAQYQRAKYVLQNKALNDYRQTLSRPITADNCDALLGTANLIQFLMWCDLGFMDAQQQHQQQHHHRRLNESTAASLDLSSDRLYFLSTGVRQIFFMAWPLFQTERSAFSLSPRRHRPGSSGLLQPCVALEESVDARGGLGWRRHARGFTALYDNPRYRGDGRCRAAAEGGVYPSPPPSSSSYCSFSFSSPSSPGTNVGTNASATDINGIGACQSSTAYLDGLFSDLSPTGAPPYKVMTLWQSYKEGEAHVRNAGTHDEGLTRAAYGRLAARLAIAMAFAMDYDRGGGGSTAFPQSSGMRSGAGRAYSCGQPQVRKSDMVRYVTTFPMMCFGPLLNLISTGDSRMLVLLFHIYHVTGMLLPEETYWWCRKRVLVMKEAIGRELHRRGFEVCLRRKNEVT